MGNEFRRHQIGAGPFAAFVACDTAFYVRISARGIFPKTACGAFVQSCGLRHIDRGRAVRPAVFGDERRYHTGPRLARCPDPGILYHCPIHAADGGEGAQFPMGCPGVSDKRAGRHSNAFGRQCDAIGIDARRNGGLLLVEWQYGLARRG